MRGRGNRAAAPGLDALVAATPADRNRVVDLVRVLALGVVVLGHWVMQGVWVTDEGTLRRLGLLGLAPWSHPWTWLLQVMPLFFLVGGYVNALSWRHAREAGTSYGSWLAARTARLSRPLLPLLAFWAVAAPGASYVGLGEDWLRVAGKASLVPTWFLAVYVVVVALTPVTLAAWERLGLWSLVLGTALAGAVDVVSLNLDGDAGFVVGGLNLLLVWGTLHQVGYGWRDGALPRASHRLALLLLGLVGALLLVRLGPYGVSMVGVSGYGVDNAAPPRVTLLLVGLAQAGTVLLAEPLLARVVAGRRVWRAVAAVGARMMTVYLWHLTALGLVLAACLWLDGAGLQAEPATREWWLSRPQWFAVLAVATLLLGLAMGRFEPVVPPRGPRTAGALLPVLEVLVTTVVVGVLASEGLVDEDGGAAWGRPLVALAVLFVLGRSAGTVGGGADRLHEGRVEGGGQVVPHAVDEQQLSPDHG